MHTSELLENQDLFQIKSLGGYTPQLGHLISCMNYARITTLDSVASLTISDLDFLMDNKSNTIGMLLFHIASVDWIYYISTIENREPTDLENEFWMPALNLGDEGRTKIKGHSLDFYLELLSTTRKKTIDAFALKEDSWLYEESDYWDGKIANNYFKWFHVLEDEINHRGQIRLIKKRIF